MLDLKKTDLVVRNLKSNGKQYEKFLGGGLSVIVSASTELKTFFYTYKIDRKNARVKLGVYPYTTVKSAVEAMEVERSRVKSAPTPELAELTRKVAANVPRTVTELCERYKVEYLNSTHVGADWRKAATGYLDRDVAPLIGKYPLKSLTKDVLLHPVSEKAKMMTAAGRRGVAANNLLATLTGMMRWAAEHGCGVHARRI